LLRGEYVFVQQSSEPVATAEATELRRFAVRCRFVYRWWFRERWLLVERPVRPVRVVQRVGAEDMLEMTAADDQQPVEAFAAHAADSALACARARGACTGALITPMPSERKTSSKSRVNLLSRSRIKKRTGTPWSSRRMIRLRACWATQALSGFAVTPARWTRLLASSMKNRM
jgi:hypothetical protein